MGSLIVSTWVSWLHIYAATRWKFQPSAVSPGAAPRAQWLLSPPPDPTPAPPSSASGLWRDWPRCSIRRTWPNVVRSQTACLDNSAPLSLPHGPCSTEKILTRAERAHWRLSWDQRRAAQCSSSRCAPAHRHAFMGSQPPLPLPHLDHVPAVLFLPQDRLTWPLSLY